MTEPQKPVAKAPKKEILRKLHQKGITSAMLIEASEEIISRQQKRVAGLGGILPGPVVIYAANQRHATELRRRMTSTLLNHGYEPEEAEKMLSTNYVKFVSAQGTEENVARPLMGTINPAIYFDHHVWATPDAAKNAFYIKQLFRSRQQPEEIK